VTSYLPRMTSPTLKVSKACRPAVVDGLGHEVARAGGGIHIARRGRMLAARDLTSIIE